MSKNNSRKLALKKETLRTLNAQQLQAVAGGGLSGIYCTVGQASMACGSTTTGDCYTIDGGGIIIRN